MKAAKWILECENYLLPNKALIFFDKLTTWTPEKSNLLRDKMVFTTLEDWFALQTLGIVA